MAQVFRRSLPSASPQVVPGQASPYDLLMAELQQQTPAPQPTFTQDQIRERIASNNTQTNLGILGQLAGDENIRNVGGQVFKKSLADRQERVSNRGVTDPLTGDTQIDPEYTTEKEQTRRGRVFEKALAFEDQRNRAQERTADKTQQHQWRMAEIAARARQGAATDSEMKELRKDLLRAQITALGGKADAAADKVAAAAEKKANAQTKARGHAQEMLGFVDKAMEQTSPLSTGMIGSALARVKGSNAFDLRRTVDTLKARIGFDELQAMRDASPTGGALGQIAIKELDMLQAVKGSLDADQSDDQLLENLGKVQSHYTNWLRVMEESRKPTQDRSGQPVGRDISAPAVAAPGGAPSGAAGGASPVPVVSPVRRLRLDPATGRLVPAQ